MLYKCVLYTLFLILSFNYSAFAKDTITWMLLDLPPVGIAQGEHKDKGIGDMISKMLAEHLPDYEHSFVRANLKRIFTDMQKGKKICLAGLIKTGERMQYGYYSSLPSHFLTPLSVIVRSSDRSRFSTLDRISIENLLNNRNLVVGMAAEISYTKEIDSIIEKHKGEKHIYIHSGGNLMESILRMIILKRMDYTLAYPWMLKYFTDEMNMSGKFASFRIIENTSPVLYYPVCVKNEWGNNLIKEIEDVLREIRPTEEYRKTMENWMLKDSLPYYRKEYENVFLKMN